MTNDSDLGKLEGGRSRTVRNLIFSFLIVAVAVYFTSKDMEAIQKYIADHETFGLIIAIAVYGILGASLVLAITAGMTSAIMNPVRAKMSQHEKEEAQRREESKAKVEDA